MTKKRNVSSIIMTLVIALTMVFAMAMTVFADHTITVTSSDKNEHTYKAYQVFAGTAEVSEGKATGKLETITWGSSVDGDTLLAALKKDSTIGTSFASASTAAEVAAVIGKFGDDSSEAKALAKVIAANTKTATATLTKGDSGYTASVADGYYLIKDETGTTTDGEAISRFMLQVNGNVTVAAKSETTKSDKKVDDKNDSDSSEDATNWQDSADYDIGDQVPFRLTATIADDYAEYKVYKLTFHDKEDEGLTFNKDSVKVSVDGNEITSGYTVKTTDITDGDTFEIVFSDLKTISSVKAGSVISVEYTSELNTKAKLGETGNKNTSHITYSNNPNDEQGGENGSTPDDTVIVFTYKFQITKFADKIDSNDRTANRLAGATFVLSKFNAAENTWKVLKTEKTDSEGLFTFTGLDDGIYKVEETDAPDGYNKIDAFYFKVTATHNDDDGTTNVLKLTALSAAECTEAGADVTNTTVTLSTSTADGSTTPNISTDIVDKSGSTLPSTGGMGTTLFYVIGVILVLGAGILLVAKRRVNEA